MRPTSKTVKAAVAAALISSATALVIRFYPTPASAQASGAVQSPPVAPASSPARGTSPSVVQQKPAADPLRAAIDKFEDYNTAHPEVDVAVEKDDDAQYMAIWRIKMTMLGTIEDLAKSLHREKEVEALMELKSLIKVESKAATLRGR